MTAISNQRILVINPNTTASMTQTIAKAARGAAAPSSDLRGHLRHGTGLNRRLL